MRPLKDAPQLGITDDPLDNIYVRKEVFTLKGEGFMVREPIDQLQVLSILCRAFGLQCYQGCDDDVAPRDGK